MNTALTSFPADLMRYLALERVSVQWAGFLGAFSEELQAQLGSMASRDLLVRAGERFSLAHDLLGCGSLGEVESAVNQIWHRIRWGYAVFTDKGSSLLIEHYACPIPAAMQLEPHFASGFLEGAYAGWLKSAGAPSDLKLVCTTGANQPMCMTFELVAR